MAKLKLDLHDIYNRGGEIDAEDSIIRIDARAKVTGDAQYPGDINLPGQLWLKVLFARRPHARIKRLDVSKAQAAQTESRVKNGLGSKPRTRSVIRKTIIWSRNTIAWRRGKKKALVAVAHSILVIAYHTLRVQRKQVYQDLGGNYFDEQDSEKTAQRLAERIEKLGYKVTLQTQPALAPA